jgi:cell pole-organizing protein PopZ
MSGSNDEVTNTAGPASTAEPSMEEILASIRRILKDEESGEPATPASAEEEEEELLVLDSSMVVKLAPPPPEPVMSEPVPVFEPSGPEPDAPILTEAEEDYPAPAEAAPAHLTSEPAALDFGAVENATFDLPALDPVEMQPEIERMEAGSAGIEKEIDMPDHSDQNVHPPHGLVSDAASEAAASSIGSLIRSISSERSIAIGRPGLTLEDIVREEVRPLLKSWLDSNLPALVERIVRAEIQRVVERTGI